MIFIWGMGVLVYIYQGDMKGLDFFFLNHDTQDVKDSQDMECRGGDPWPYVGVRIMSLSFRGGLKPAPN